MWVTSIMFRHCLNIQKNYLNFQVSLCSSCITHKKQKVWHSVQGQTASKIICFCWSANYLLMLSLSCLKPALQKALSPEEGNSSTKGSVHWMLHQFTTQNLWLSLTKCFSFFWHRHWKRQLGNKALGSWRVFNSENNKCQKVKFQQERCSTRTAGCQRYQSNSSSHVQALICTTTSSPTSLHTTAEVLHSNKNQFLL